MARKSNMTLCGIHGAKTGHAGNLEQFDPKYKGLLPLTRVYVPGPLAEAEG